ncbi:MAG: hypothetical protein WBA89_19475 [Microcoleus sp.]
MINIHTFPDAETGFFSKIIGWGRSDRAWKNQMGDRPQSASVSHS